jgi:hypothetical protein
VDSGTQFSDDWLGTSEKQSAKGNVYGRSTVIAGPSGSNTAIIRRGRNRAAIRVEQYLLGIKSQPALRGKGPIYTIPVNLARFDSWHKDMPVMTAVG